jgi:predicted nucleotidyltransferase component of viral defense system
MTISQQRLMEEASATGFRPEILEKVIHLLNLLENFRAHPFLKNRCALKGGTALNLFLFNVPRLSVDIDLNYIASPDRAVMLEEKPKLEKALTDVFGREGFTVSRQPAEHAGGKWRLSYPSVVTDRGNLEVDVNFMLRVPLWTPVVQDSRSVGSYRAGAIHILDVHELAAGKLVALLARHASRDLFDAHQLLTTQKLDPEKLRLGFVLYGAMNRKDWRGVALTDIAFDAQELREQLLPLLNASAIQTIGADGEWATRLVERCRKEMEMVLPLRPAEREFLDRLNDKGEIRPELLTVDQAMAAKIAQHPQLLWKATNVRQHKGR